LKINDKWFVPVFLIALTLLAAGLRFYHLSFSNWWCDEAWSGFLTTVPWYFMNGSDVHPFLSYALIRISTTVLGMSEFSLRLVPCIFGIIAIPISWWFAKELTGKNFVGIITALLMTVSIFQIEQSQTARMYTIIGIWFMLMVIFFFRAYKNNKDIDWYIATLFAILLIFTWYYSVIPIGITILWYFLREGKKPLKNKAFLYSAIAFIFAGILMLPSFLSAVAMKSTENNNLVYRNLEVIYQIGITFLGSPPLLAGFIAIIAFVGCILLFNDNETVGGYFGLQIMVSITFGALISNFLMILPRYFFYIGGPIFYTLIGYFIYRVLKSTKVEWKGAVAAGFILLLVVGSFCMVLPSYYAVQHNYSGEFNSMKESFAEIKGNATTVAMVGNPAFIFLYQYYIKDPSITVVRFDNLTRMRAAIEGQPSLVMIPDYDIPADQPEAKVIYDWLQGNGVRKTIYRGFEVYEVNI
jgi:hypothetical protein